MEDALDESTEPPADDSAPAPRTSFPAPATWNNNGRCLERETPSVPPLWGGHPPSSQDKEFNGCMPVVWNAPCFSQGIEEFELIPAEPAVQCSAPRPRVREGLVSYSVDISMPLVGPPLRVGTVWFLSIDRSSRFQKAMLALHANGLAIKPLSDGPNGGKPESAHTIAWSPFSLVQACRLHNQQADAAVPYTRLFAVSLFHHNMTLLFATEGDTADIQRMQWVAEISRSLRDFTGTLVPPSRLTVFPLKGREWTATRLIANWMLMTDEHGVSLVFCELHSHWGGRAAFAVYEDEFCEVRVHLIPLTLMTIVSERLGVDCSCFKINNFHFLTRTRTERQLWLRAISNVMVKVRHRTENPTPQDLANFRRSIEDRAKSSQRLADEEDGAPRRPPLLPRQGVASSSSMKFPAQTAASWAASQEVREGVARITAAIHGPMARHRAPSGPPIAIEPGAQSSQSCLPHVDGDAPPPPGSVGGAAACFERPGMESPRASCRKFSHQKNEPTSEVSKLHGSGHHGVVGFSLEDDLQGGAPPWLRMPTSQPGVSQESLSSQGSKESQPPYSPQDMTNWSAVPQQQTLTPRTIQGVGVVTAQDMPEGCNNVGGSTNSASAAVGTARQPAVGGSPPVTPRATPISTSPMDSPCSYTSEFSDMEGPPTVPPPADSKVPSEGVAMDEDCKYKPLVSMWDSSSDDDDLVMVSI